MRAFPVALDLHHLSIFCMVYELGAISAAAKKVHLTQPTVSSHLHALESEVGGLLFERSARGVTPTPAGEALYRSARELVAEAAEMERSIRRYMEGQKGKVRLAASSVPGGYVLPRLLNAFRRRHEDVEIRLEIKNSANVLELVAEGGADLGVVGMRSNRPDLVFSELVADHLVVVAAPSTRWGMNGEVSADELRQTSLLMRESGSGSRGFLERTLRQAGLTPETVRAAGSYGSATALKEAVKAGAGLAAMSRRVVADELALGTLVEVRAEALPSLTRMLYWVRAPGREPTPACAVLAAFLDEYAESGAGLDESR